MSASNLGGDARSLSAIPDFSLALSVADVCRANSIGDDYALCIPRARINFTSPNFTTSSNTDGSILMGIGVDRARFGEVFGAFGRVTFIGEAP
jgi:hypothetical protein